MYARPAQELAAKYHGELPQRIRSYLNRRGIPDRTIDTFLLGWNGSRITIPIFGRDADLVLFKLAKDPDDQSSSPKMLTPPGASAELYGWDRVLAKPDRIIICEGEFDRLVLESRGFAAVTSTGGAGTFRAEWAEALKEIPGVYVCFDNDIPGRSGVARVARLIPHARVVCLPDEVGEGGDVTDFFVRLAKDREDFARLLGMAQLLPPEALGNSQKRHGARQSPMVGGEPQHLKSLVTIDNLIGRYIQLRPRGQNLAGRCPFHEDRTPSFLVYPWTGTFHCFGCNAHGDAITFLMRIEHLNFPEALRALREVAEQHE
jgi:DNA primase